VEKIIDENVMHTIITDDGKILGWTTHADSGEVLPPELLKRFHEGAGFEDNLASYDYYDHHDIFYLCVPEALKDSDSLPQFGAYISKSEVLIMYTHWEDRVNDFIPELLKTVITKKFSIQRAMLSVIDFLTKNDGKHLSKISETIISLEAEIMKSADTELKGKNDKIILFRQQLHPMQKMYEQLIDALDDLMENENGMFSETDIKYALRIHNRVERLYKTVLNMKDYVTQVREAYQSQIDIGLNSIMKIFTVLSAVFLPLTLLAAWYGMNFEHQPEFGWRYGYIGVIAVSLMIIFSCVLFFKSKKWF
jgi:magnesium transporter